MHIRWSNVLLAALWFGAGHPDMVMFLNPFVNEINRIGTITWESGGHVMNSGVQIVCCCVDAPARAAVLNMKQFNGYYGCTWCLQKGTYLNGKQLLNRHIDLGTVPSSLAYFTLSTDEIGLVSNLINLESDYKIKTGKNKQVRNRHKCSIFILVTFVQLQ